MSDKPKRKWRIVKTTDELPEVKAMREEKMLKDSQNFLDALFGQKKRVI
jgi:hypothetical protein